MFKKIRITILLLILLSVALTAWRTSRSAHDWRSNQFVGLYPINADGSPAVSAYLATLDQDSFKPIQVYMTAEMQNHGMDLPRALTVELGPEIKLLPPPLPTQGSALQAIRWSLEMRWWAWRNTPKTVVKPEVRIYLVYHDPAAVTRVPDSSGLAKGRIGVAHLFAGKEMQGSNLVVTTHELLHTFGANDKYDPATLQPLDPQGYAEPDKLPLLPQLKAEIMAGRIPKSSTEAIIPLNLAETLIGQQTATEIGWIKPAK